MGWSIGEQPDDITGLKVYDSDAVVTFNRDYCKNQPSDTANKIVLLTFINIRDEIDWVWLKLLQDVQADSSDLMKIAIIYSYNDMNENFPRIELACGPSQSYGISELQDNSWINRKVNCYHMNKNFTWLKCEIYTSSTVQTCVETFGGSPCTFLLNRGFKIIDKWQIGSTDSGNSQIGALTGWDEKDLFDFDWDSIIAPPDPPDDNDHIPEKFHLTEYRKLYKMVQFTDKRITDLLNNETYIIDVDPSDGQDISPGGTISVTFSGKQGAVYYVKKPLAAWDTASYKIEGVSTQITSVDGDPYTKYKASEYLGDTKETRIIQLGELAGFADGQQVSFSVDANLRDTNEKAFMLEGGVASINYTVATPNPDLYMRDNLTDIGDMPSSGGLAQSPDIFVLQTQFNQIQAQANYGGNSTNENVIPPATVDGTQQNYVYVRVKNRGPIDANDVNITVYFTEPSALPTPEDWIKVNEAEPTVTIATVPSGEELTCSQGVEWTNYPYTGHYCFIGAVDHPDDAVPSFSDVQTIGFSDFIRNHNNITWRNFNVVENDPPPPPPDAPSGFVILPFMFHGAERKKRMQLEIVERLPIGSSSMMEVPIDLLQFIKRREKSLFKTDPKRKVVWMKLHTSGKNLTPVVALPEKHKARLRIFVDIPKLYRTRKNIIYVRQLYKGKEIGRISWLLVPKKNKTWPGFKEPAVKTPGKKMGDVSGKPD